MSLCESLSSTRFKTSEGKGRSVAIRSRIVQVASASASRSYGWMFRQAYRQADGNECIQASIQDTDLPWGLCGEACHWVKAQLHISTCQLVCMTTAVGIYGKRFVGGLCCLCAAVSLCTRSAPGSPQHTHAVLDPRVTVQVRLQPHAAVRAAGLQTLHQCLLLPHT